MIGNVVKLIQDRGTVGVGDKYAPHEHEMVGELREHNQLGATVFDDKLQACVFVPTHRIIEIIDQGRRGGW